MISRMWGNFIEMTFWILIVLMALLLHDWLTMKHPRPAIYWPVARIEI